MTTEEPHQFPTPILETNYRRILDSLQLMWGFPSEFDAYLNKLELSDRLGRAGFPPEAFQELMFLRFLHSDAFGEGGTTGHNPWDLTQSQGHMGPI